MPAPDIFTYRYNGSMVYVPPGTDYEHGIRLVRENFPELADVDPSRISICVNGVVSKQPAHVRIGPEAWTTVVPTLTRFEVLEIFVRPETKASGRSRGNSPTSEREKSSRSNGDSLPDYDEVRNNDFLNAHMHPPHGHLPRKPSNASMSDWVKSLFGKRAN